MSELSRIERARLAKELQGNPVLQEALGRMRDVCIERLEEVSLRDAEGLAIAHQQLRVINLFRQILAGYVEDGKLAASEWERATSARKRRIPGL